MTKISVLVVDDDTDIRNLVAMVLDDEGYAVEIAHDGSHAFERLKSIMPQLILLDWNMPGMNGLEFLRQKARDPQLTDLPVIVMTAAGEPPELHDPLLASEAGLRGTIMKPIGLDELLDAVGKTVACA